MNIEYFLGFDSSWEEYIIVEHNVQKPKGDGTFCFQIGESGVSDGDGFPASYDDTFVKIDEKDYRYVINLFHKVGKEMCAIAEKEGRHIGRSIVAGDYIYDGGYFIHFQNISNNREKLWIKEFYYDGYDLTVDTDLAVVGKEDDYDIEELEADGLLITEDIYHQALNIAKSAILEITDYLRTIKRNASEKNDQLQI